jgi:NifU-like protein involved in Fe-S cluster formation
MSTAIYTPEMLRAAVSLADYPRLAHPTISHNSRAVPCGSYIDMDLKLDTAGAISAIGVSVQACAVGQAAAAAFTRYAVGKNLQDTQQVCAAIEAWLGGAHAPIPDWPELDIIASARDYPARHGAIKLAFWCARDALAKHAEQAPQAAQAAA